MGEWRIARLERAHLRDGFDCGKPSLNGFLHSLVTQYEKRNLGRTYVALPAADQRVMGYYTLAIGAIDVESLPANEGKKLPRHPVPIVLIARLAVDRSVQGRGLGEFCSATHSHDRWNYRKALESTRSSSMHSMMRPRRSTRNTASYR